MPKSHRTRLVRAEKITTAKSAALPIQPAALSIIDASRYLGVSRASIYRLLSKPNAPFKVVRVGGRVVLPIRVLDAFLYGSPEQPSDLAAEMTAT